MTSASSGAAGELGLQHYRTLIGDDADAPLYAIVDSRQDGRRRIVAEFRDPDAAQRCAALLRDAGSDAGVVLITEVREGSPP